jgi:hypothetical protein
MSHRSGSPLGNVHHPIVQGSIVAVCLFVFGLSSILAQTIDFETIPGTVPTDGLQIADQFLATLGVRFSLENGDRPVLAQRIGSISLVLNISSSSQRPGSSGYVNRSSDQKALSGQHTAEPESHFRPSYC